MKAPQIESCQLQKLLVASSMLSSEQRLVLRYEKSGPDTLWLRLKKQKKRWHVTPTQRKKVTCYIHRLMIFIFLMLGANFLAQTLKITTWGHAHYELHILLQITSTMHLHHHSQRTFNGDLSFSLDLHLRLWAYPFACFRLQVLGWECHV